MTPQLVALFRRSVYVEGRVEPWVSSLTKHSYSNSACASIDHYYMDKSIKSSRARDVTLRYVILVYLFVQQRFHPLLHGMPPPT
jgi:hypothetical protein